MADAITADSIKDKLRGSLAPSELNVDLSGEGCGLMVDIFVVSDKFDTMSRLDRQRAVTDTLTEAGYMDSIHAVTIKAITPAQRAKQLAK